MPSAFPFAVAESFWIQHSINLRYLLAFMRGRRRHDRARGATFLSAAPDFADNQPNLFLGKKLLFSSSLS
jgi:hypothetical protein